LPSYKKYRLTPIRCLRDNAVVPGVRLPNPDALEDRTPLDTIIDLLPLLEVADLQKLGELQRMEVEKRRLEEAFRNSKHLSSKLEILASIKVVKVPRANESTKLPSAANPNFPDVDLLTFRQSYVIGASGKRLGFVGSIQIYESNRCKYWHVELMMTYLPHPTSDEGEVNAFVWYNVSREKWGVGGIAEWKATARQGNVRRVFELVGKELGVEGCQDDLVSEITEAFLGSTFFRWEISNSGLPKLRNIIMDEVESREVCISW
jgi:hypothetical protein